MNKTILFRITSLVLVLALSILAVIPLDRAKTDRANWMADLVDGTPLNALSIPGTHDSGALYSFADVSGKCQTLCVADQLQIGVRFLDIRLQLVDDELRVVHSFVDQKTELGDLLDDIAVFLRAHPTEFLLVSFKEDAAPKRSEVDFAEKLEQMLQGYGDILSTATTLPATVGEARGKMHVLARYADATIGLPCYDGWKDDTSFLLDNVYVQDHYSVGNTGEKFLDISDAFVTASTREHALVLNYTSCYLSGGFPPIYAGLPAHDLHTWMEASIPLIDGPLGILLCDFITSDMAELIIGRNFQ